MTEVAMPQNVLAEKFVIGSMLISRDAAEKCSGILRTEDFYDVKNGVIFGAIQSLMKQGNPVDLVSVSDRMIASGDLALIGGFAELANLTSEVSTPTSATYYAELVKEASKLRRVAEAGQRMLHMATTPVGQEGAEAVAGRAREMLDGVLTDVATDVHTIGSGFDEHIASLTESPQFCPTGWPDLDKVIDGFRPGALYIVAARPGEGKSIFGLQAAAALAQYGDPVAMSTLEMGENEVFNRLISMQASIPLSAINRRELSDHHWDQIQRVRPQIERLPIYVDDRASVTIDDIRAHVRAVSRHGRIAGLVVDYLQIMSAAVKGQSRVEAVGEMSRALKIMARDYSMPVIALAQLNRAATEGRPQLHHLRESGSLEQDADVVIMQARERDIETDQFTDFMDMWVEKNRSGPTGHSQFFFEGPFVRITDLGRFRDNQTPFG